MPASLANTHGSPLAVPPLSLLLFALIHCEVCISPVLSTSGFKYYLVLLNDYSHFLWSFRLRHKSDVHHHIVELIAYAHTQLGPS
jgi:hypothetical protein